MSKKQQLLSFLNENIFDPIISAPYASSQLKNDFLCMREMLKDFSAKGILYFVWISLFNQENEIILCNRLIDEGFHFYKSVTDNFKENFSYEWLLSS